MNDPALLLSMLAGSVSLAALCQQLDLINRGSHYLEQLVARTEDFLNGESSYTQSLPEQLPYRDFDAHSQVIETSGGYIWQGLRLSAIASDGFSARQWNEQAQRFNSLYSGLPTGTKVQIIHRISPDSSTAVTALNRLSAHCPSIVRYCAQAQGRFLRHLARQGTVKEHDTWAYIGRPLTIPLVKSTLGTLRANLFANPDAETYQQDVTRLNRLTKVFAQAYQGLGGNCTPLTANETWQLAWQLLNPNLANKIAAPNLQPVPSTSDLTKPSAHNQVIAVNNIASDDSYKINPTNNVTNNDHGYIGNLIDDHVMYYPIDQGSPRQQLTGEMFRRGTGYLEIINLLGSTYCSTISFGRLPTQVRPGQLELLLRHPDITFPLYISSMFEIGDQMAVDAQFERATNKIQQRWRVSLVEQNKLQEYQAIRQEMLDGQVVGTFGIKVIITATSLEQLKERQEIVMQILRFQEASAVVDTNIALEDFLAALPCASAKDFYAKAVLSGHAACLSALTGPPTGVEPPEASAVFLTPAGNPFYWNSRNPQVNNRMCALIGEPGSGKSGLINWLRILELLQGRRGVTIDYGGSSERLCHSVKGRYYQMNDPALRLGVFDIAVRNGESYQPEEITPQGLSKEGLMLVGHMLEMLSLNPGETGLDARLNAVLREAVQITYERLETEIPVLADFITTLNQMTADNRERGRELGSRLQVYTQDSGLAHFLNESSSAPAIDSPYTVFNFSGLQQDPRQMLVASLAILQFLNRFMRTGSKVAKFVDVDELHYITNNALLRRVVDLTIRTARKENCVVMLSTQSPADLKHEDLRGTVSSISTYWLMKLPQPELVKEHLGLSSTVVETLRRLNVGLTNARDCVLIENSSVAILRLMMDPLTARLCLGKGRDMATLTQALNYVPMLESEKEHLAEVLNL